jgi:hypothetical protein
MLDGGRHALVDLGWRGTSGLALAEVLEHAGHAPPTFFYLGYQGADNGAERPIRDRQEAWLFDAERHEGAPLDGWLCGYLIESFCAGGHGPVLGYEERPEGGVGPVLRAARNEAVIDWGLADVRAVVADAVSALLSTLHFVDTHADLRAPVAAVLEELWYRPTPDEAGAWGAFPHEFDQAGDHRATLARPLSVSSLARAASGDSGVAGPWVGAAVASSPAPIRHGVAIGRVARRKGATLVRVARARATARRAGWAAHG